MNGEYVNKFNTNWPGIFGSRETSKEFGLPEPINKVEAAIPYIKGMCMNGGGSRRRRRRSNTTRPILYKKKSIHRYKKMSHVEKIHARSRSGGKSRRSSKNKRSIKGRRSSRRGRSRKQSGGDMQTRYHQFGSNIPDTPSYSVGGIVSAKHLGLANPPPYQKLSNCTNCVDNYNHYTNKGFQFW